MDNDVTELLTQNESGQTKSAAGGTGDDRIVSLIVAQAAGSPALAGSNSHLLTGNAGNDSLSGEVVADASAGGTATASGNVTTLAGGGGDASRAAHCGPWTQ